MSSKSQIYCRGKPTKRQCDGRDCLIVKKSHQMRLSWILLALLLTVSAWAEPIVGAPLPSWEGLRWLGKAPSTKGRVVLIRYFTDGCHYCTNTVPSLLRLEQEFPQLLVIGIYHPKPARAVSPAQVKKASDNLGIDFPVACDANWTVLHRWWLDRSEADFTSVSFLLDQQGVVRWLHPGGEYPPGSEELKQLRTKIELLLHTGKSKTR